MKRAIRAGVDSVEHGTYMDEEAMHLMREQGHLVRPHNFGWKMGWRSRRAR
jgi:imidazolonepropionase-like amidohydrolase